MAKLPRRRALKNSLFEIHSFQGRNHGRRRYVLLRGVISNKEHFEAFVATELKGACADILGIDDAEARETISNRLAKKVWDGAQ